MCTAGTVHCTAHCILKTARGKFDSTQFKLLAISLYMENNWTCTLHGRPGLASKRPGLAGLDWQAWTGQWQPWTGSVWTGSVWTGRPGLAVSGLTVPGLAYQLCFPLSASLCSLSAEQENISSYTDISGSVRGLQIALKYIVSNNWCDIGSQDVITS